MILLSSFGIRDDEFDMDGKLSQTPPEPWGDDRRGGIRIGRRRSIEFSLVGLLAIVLSIGCDGNGAGPGASSSFDWPQDPGHPAIRIELTGAAGEGVIEIELMPELAPQTVEQILAWADEGYFDGTTFHRVIKDFMIQGGDPNSRDEIPTNDGLGGPGFVLDDEFTAAPFVRGVVGMGNTGRRNSAGSQFFIMQADQRNLDGAYTVIGRVRSGIEMVDAVVDVEIDKVGRWGPMSRPIENVVMARVRRVGANSDSAIATTASTHEEDRRSDEPLQTRKKESPAPPASPAS